MYVICVLCTQPGTEMNVTPESEAPNIPKATIYHGLFLLPRKKPSLLVLREVIRLIIIRSRKYVAIIPKINPGDIINLFFEN
jgi:hypothetical protein